MQGATFIFKKTFFERCRSKEMWIELKEILQVGFCCNIQHITEKHDVGFLSQAKAIVAEVQKHVIQQSIFCFSMCPS